MSSMFKLFSLLFLRVDLRPHSFERWIGLNEPPYLAASLTLKPSFHEASYSPKSF
ncbi:hypothetical protein C7436_3544 [Marinobacter nauticus]|nr:hypothetical protein C7436_3544 [Marinobacter nauticus]